MAVRGRRQGEAESVSADELYWSLIDSSRLPSPVRSYRAAARRREALDALLEEDLPCGLEQVHTTYLALGDGRVIGCAAPVELVARLRQGQTAACPDRIPDLCTDLPGHATSDRLNMLHGVFEPDHHRRGRRAMRRTFLVGWVLVSSAVLIGGGRRAEVMQAEAAELQRRGESLMESVAGPRSTASGQPAWAIFQSEVNRIRGEPVQTDLVDIGLDLPSQFSLLAEHWPEEPARRVQRLELMPQRILINASVDSPEDAAAFAASLRSIPGWQRGMPSVSNTASGTTIQFDLIPAQEKQP